MLLMAIVFVVLFVVMIAASWNADPYVQGILGIGFGLIVCIVFGPSFYIWLVQVSGRG